jgi:hypothetical protein
MNYRSGYYSAYNIQVSCEYYLGDNWWDHFYPEFVTVLIDSYSSGAEALRNLKNHGATQQELYCHPVYGFGVNFDPSYNLAPSGWTKKIFYINCCLLDDDMCGKKNLKPERLRIKEYGDFFDKMKILGWENA